jgi:hypothetical protein
VLSRILYLANRYNQKVDLTANVENEIPYGGDWGMSEYVFDTLFYACMAFDWSQIRNGEVAYGKESMVLRGCDAVGRIITCIKSL